MSVAIYPGSFDPLTNGHMDIINRAAKTFERLVVAVSSNPQKSHTFDLHTRLSLLKECLGHLTNVEFDSFDTLLIDYAHRQKIYTVIRGLRAVSDFEYELHLAAMNKRLSKDVETVFLMTGESSYFVSSRLVREVASFSGDVSSLVPAPVAAALRERYKQASSKET